MIDQELKDYVNHEIETAFLAVPELVSKLFIERMAMRELAKKFYDNNKEFKKHGDIVASVLEEIEGKNPGKKYADLLVESVPIIQKRIALIEGLDTTDGVTKPEDLRIYESDVSNHGIL